MPKFDFTAQMVLAAPKNVRSVMNTIGTQLGSISVPISLTIPQNLQGQIAGITAELGAFNKAIAMTASNASSAAKSLMELGSAARSLTNASSSISNAGNQVAASMNKTNVAIDATRNKMEEFGRVSGLAIRRFAGFTVATGATFGFLGALTHGVREAIAFQDQMVKIAQISGTTVKGLGDLDQVVSKLSANIGIASKELLEATKTFIEAGFSVTETKIAMDTLAKTMATPTFGKATDTMDAMISSMATFKITARELNAEFDSINTLSAKFAVESKDIVDAIKRSGAAFASMNTDITTPLDSMNQFIATFTAVRATTRESAESIATGMRTIFTRMSRSDTIENLRAIGIELTDLQGKFVGPWEATNRLAVALKGLNPRDTQFLAIAEQLGGYRQINKILPMIQQTEVRMRAYQEAQRSQGSLDANVAESQESLARQFTKVHESFLALMRDMTNTGTMRTFIDLALSLAKGLIQVGEATKPIVPFLATIAVVKGFSALSNIIPGVMRGVQGQMKPTDQIGGATGFAGTIGQAIGGAAGGNSLANTTLVSAMAANTLAVQNLTIAVKGYAGARGFKFAGGGLVPGHGDGDTVPAMMQPGEFVIRKKAVEAIGADRLQGINKYSRGGNISVIFAETSGATFVPDYTVSPEAIIAKDDKQNTITKKYKVLQKETQRIYGLEDSKKKDIIESTINELNLHKNITDDLLVKYQTGIIANQPFKKNKSIETELNTPVKKDVEEILNRQAGYIADILGRGKIQNTPIKNVDDVLAHTNYANYRGSLFEGASHGLQVNEISNISSQATYDYINGLGKLGDALGINSTNIGEAKIKLNDESKRSLHNKAINWVLEEAVSTFRGVATNSKAMSESDKTIQKEKAKQSALAKTARLNEIGDKGLWRVASDDEKAIVRQSLGEKLNKYSTVDGQQLTVNNDFILRNTNVKSSEEHKKVLTKLLKPFGYHASGGSVDSVPAMLTPGEFVINKQAADAIGVGKLRQLNQADKIQGFARGGPVQYMGQGDRLLSRQLAIGQLGGEGRIDTTAWSDAQVQMKLLGASTKDLIKWNENIIKAIAENKSSDEALNLATQKFTQARDNATKVHNAAKVPSATTAAMALTNVDLSQQKGRYDNLASGPSMWTRTKETVGSWAGGLKNIVQSGKWGGMPPPDFGDLQGDALTQAKLTHADQLVTRKSQMAMRMGMMGMGAATIGGLVGGPIGDATAGGAGAASMVGMMGGGIKMIGAAALIGGINGLIQSGIADRAKKAQESLTDSLTKLDKSFEEFNKSGSLETLKVSLTNANKSMEEIFASRIEQDRGVFGKIVGGDIADSSSDTATKMGVGAAALGYGGMKAGAAIGSFVPGYGTVIGGAIGGGLGLATGAIGGYFMGDKGELGKKEKDRAKMLGESASAIGSKSDQLLNTLLKKGYTGEKLEKAMGNTQGFAISHMDEKQLLDYSKGLTYVQAGKGGSAKTKEEDLATAKRDMDRLQEEVSKKVMQAAQKETEAENELARAMSKVDFKTTALTANLEQMSAIIGRIGTIGEGNKNLVSSYMGAEQGGMGAIAKESHYNPFATPMASTQDELKIGMRDFKSFYGDTPQTQRLDEGMQVREVIQKATKIALDNLEKEVVAGGAKGTKTAGGAEGDINKAVREALKTAGLFNTESGRTAYDAFQTYTNQQAGKNDEAKKETLTTAAHIKQRFSLDAADKVSSEKNMKVANEGTEAMIKQQEYFRTKNQEIILRRLDLGNRNVDIEGRRLQQSNELQTMFSNRRLTTGEAFAPTAQRVSGLAGTTDVGQIMATQGALMTQRQKIDQAMAQPGLKSEERDVLAQQLAENQGKLDNNTKALDLLSKDTSRLSVIQGKMADIESQRQGGRNTIEKVLFGGPEGRRQMAMEQMVYGRFEQTGKLPINSAQMMNYLKGGMQTAMANAPNEQAKEDILLKVFKASGAQNFDVFKAAMTSKGDSEMERDLRQQANILMESQIKIETDTVVDEL